MPSFQTGDVFASIFPGKVYWYRKDGTFVQILDTLTGNFTAGSFCDKNGNLYVTCFDGQIVKKFDNQGNLLGSFGSGGSYGPGFPESILIDRAGNVWVGQTGAGPGTPGTLLKFNGAGTLLATFSPTPDNSLGSSNGIDWIDLASDERTMYYTGEGYKVKAFDVVANSQLADFATLPNHNVTITAATNAPQPQLTAANHGLANAQQINVSGFTGNWTPENQTSLSGHQTVAAFVDASHFKISQADSTGFGAMTGSPVVSGYIAFAMRLLASGGMLVANNQKITRLDGTGAVIQSYAPSPNQFLFALNLDPDGTSFWTADTTSALIYKVDIASGNVLLTINTGVGPNVLFGLSVFGELTAQTTGPAAQFVSEFGPPAPLPSFVLSKFVACLRPAKHLPVRGAAN